MLQHAHNKGRLDPQREPFWKFTEALYFPNGKHRNQLLLRRLDWIALTLCYTSDCSEFINRDWVPKVKIVIFDFDKTITNKHTGGSVLLPVHATDEFIEGNFADLEFLKVKAVSLILCCCPFGCTQGSHEFCPVCRAVHQGARCASRHRVIWRG